MPENVYDQYPRRLYNTSTDHVSDLIRKEPLKYAKQCSWSSVTFSYWALLSVAVAIYIYILVINVTAACVRGCAASVGLLVTGKRKENGDTEDCKGDACGGWN